MSAWRGDNSGGEQGGGVGAKAKFSPVAPAALCDSRTAGGRFPNRPRTVPSLKGHEPQAASRVTRLLPVIPSPYGDDYLRTSLSTTSIIGIVAA